MRRNIDQKNSSNDGRAFEREIEMTVKGYDTARRASMEKVEPPTRTVGGGAFRKVIYLSNPFLDFVGTWTERGGRALFIEAKSTSKKRLSLCRDDGLKESQWHAMTRWHDAGAAVGVLWHRKDLGRVRFVSRELLAAAIGNGAVSLEWDLGWDPVEPGQGFILHDFLKNLARIYPEK